MRLSLRPGERVYVNGAVLRVDRKVGIELLNDATFLLESHVLQAEAATTPLRQLYFAAQTMLIDPAQAEAARRVYAGVEAGLIATIRDRDILSGLLSAQALVAEGRTFEALKLIRGLFPAEAARLAAGGEPPPPAAETAVAQPPGPARPGPRPRGPADATRHIPTASPTPSTRPEVARNPEA